MSGLVIVFALAAGVVLTGVVLAVLVALRNRREGHGTGATSLPASPGSPHGTGGGSVTGVFHTDGGS